MKSLDVQLRLSNCINRLKPGKNI